MDTTIAETKAVARSERRSRFRRALRALLSPLFLLSVALPTGFAAIYYGFIASDTYVSESRFVVRSPQRQQLSGLGAILQGTGFSSARDDTYSVHDYILSRDALHELQNKLDVEKMYSSPDIDPLNRFTSLEWDKSFESFFKYYKKRVTIDYDSVSSISVLTVHAYTAKEAHDINDVLLNMGERLVNTLNDRSRGDLLNVASAEVKAAEDRARAASLALSGFRSKQSVFDPERQAAMQLQGKSRVEEELLATEAQLAQLRQLAPDNPQIPTLTSRAALLRREIANQGAKVAGRQQGSFTTQSSGYDRLQLDKTFAERQLAAAFVSLESAKSEAQRQQLYLERLVKPNLPDSAIEPRRLRMVAMVFLLGLIVWGVLSLVVASVREHAE